MDVPHLLTANRFSRTIRYVPDLRLVYVNNPKAACSSIKKSLWLAHDRRKRRETFPGTPHATENSPFVHRLSRLSTMKERLCDATFFSVVRNPFSRVASAYLDKIHGQNCRPPDRAVFLPFAERFGLPPSRALGFDEVVRLIASENPDLLDPHFRPQVRNLLTGFLPLDRVFHLEAPDGMHAFLDKARAPMAEHAVHKTGASARLTDLMDGTVAGAIRTTYRADFAALGYGSDPNVAPAASESVVDPSRTVFRLLLDGADARQRRATRCDAFAALAETAPAVDGRHLMIEFGLMEPHEIDALAEAVVAGTVRNWRLAAGVAAALIARDRIVAASACLDAARTLMASREPFGAGPVALAGDPHLVGGVG